MKLILSRPRGFCAGVVRAIEIVEKALLKFGSPIYVKHEIVHNRHVVERLKQKGAIFVEDLSLVPPGSYLIYSAHGVPPEVRLEAKKRGLKEIDATCGLVTKIHSAVKRFHEKGYTIILIGHKKHVEVIGTLGEAPEKTFVVENVKDVAALPFSANDKLFFTTQTTLSLYEVEEISQALRARFPSIETLPSSSICYATTHRQMALKEIVKEAELILVVGDPKSSNSNRLNEVAKREGVKSFLINSDDEMDLSWFQNVKTIGLTSGASTPEEIVQKVISRLKEWGVEEIEEKVFIEENVRFSLPDLLI